MPSDLPGFCQKHGGAVMRKLFNPDSPIMYAMGTLTDCLWSGLLWLLCSIPIFTIGAATTALYRVMFNLHEDKPATPKEFFAEFAHNFVQSTVIWLMMLLFAAGLFFCQYYVRLVMGKTVQVLAGIVFAAALYLFTVTLLYVFPLTAYFQNSAFHMMHNAFFIGAGNLPCTFSVLLVALLPAIGLRVIPGLVLSILPLLTVLLPGLLAYCISGRLGKLFPRYATPAELL